MTILSHDELCSLIDDGVIEGAQYEAVNSASIDIHLGNTFLLESQASGPDHILYLNKKSAMVTNRLQMADGGVLSMHPGQFLLAQSKEIFHLPNDISAEYKLKSSMARIGLEHLNAGWCDAGWNGSVLTLELKNVTQNHSIILTVGDRIGQMVFYRHKPVPLHASYATRGSYNNDKHAQGVKTK